MNSYTLYIKHMCCRRCIEAVEAVLVALNLKVIDVRLGVAVFESDEFPDKLLAEKLSERGFEIIVSEDDQLTEKVKAAIIQRIHNTTQNKTGKPIQEYLEEITLKPFRLVNKIFLSCTQLTIQKYTILQKIERVKMLIDENQYNFSEIADQVGYKTPQHLSGQFKKITGMSMQEYKTNGLSKRTPIDRI